MKGRVLIIAGSDPSGGAGIQADIKTVTALGGYAMTAVTAVTVQNTRGVFGVHQIPADIIADQIRVALADIGADVIKVGMIGDLAAAEVIEAALKRNLDIPVVLDPVLVATSGDRLAKDGVALFVKDQLIPISTVLTPNLPEAETLSGVTITDGVSRDAAARGLLRQGAKAVLLKGGHAQGKIVEDLLFTENDREIFSSPRLKTTSTHGTGCTLASAVAISLAQGLGVKASVRAGIAYTQGAIRTAPGFGVGYGPLNHCHRLT